MVAPDVASFHIEGHSIILSSLWSGQRRQCHSLVFVPLSFQCQPPCQSSDKQPVTRHYEECIMPVMGAAKHPNVVGGLPDLGWARRPIRHDDG